MNRLKKASALLLAVLMLIPLLLVPVPAAAEEDEENVTEYVLILANNPAQARNDPDYYRAAAAKLFVDILPADNVKLTVFVLANKDTGNGIIWGKGDKAHRYPALRCYQLALNRDHIHDPSTKDRMQCVYQVGSYSETQLSGNDREQIKAMIDWIYHDKPTENVYNDLHCAVYAAMDYLAFNEIKNACILMIADESTADATWFPREDGTWGDFYWAICDALADDETRSAHQGEPSFSRWIEQGNTRIQDAGNGELPYSWSFNWIDMTTPKFRTEKKITTKSYDFFSALCGTSGGEFHQVTNSNSYAALPAWAAAAVGIYIAGEA